MSLGRVLLASLSIASLHCSSGTEVVGDQSGVRAIARDETHLYWARESSGNEENSGTISRMPLGGGAVEVLATGLRRPKYLVVDDSAVYCVTVPLAGGSRIQRVAKTGGSPRVLFEWSAAWSVGLVRNATDLFSATDGLSPPGGQLVRRPLSDADVEATVLVNEHMQVTSLSLDATHVYFATRGLRPSDDSNAPVPPDAIRRVPIAGGPSEIITTTERPSAIAAGGGFVYWANAGDHTIRKAPAAGGAETVLVRDTAPDGWVDELVLSGERLFWLETTTVGGTKGGGVGVPGALWAVTTNGLDAHRVADVEAAHSLLVTDDAFFWADSLEGAVYTLPRGESER